MPQAYQAGAECVILMMPQINYVCEVFIVKKAALCALVLGCLLFFAACGQAGTGNQAGAEQQTMPEGWHWVEHQGLGVKFIWPEEFETRYSQSTHDFETCYASQYGTGFAQVSGLFLEPAPTDDTGVVLGVVKGYSMNAGGDWEEDVSNTHKFLYIGLASDWDGKPDDTISIGGQEYPCLRYESVPFQKPSSSGVSDSMAIFVTVGGKEYVVATSYSTEDPDPSIGFAELVVQSLQPLEAA